MAQKWNQKAAVQAALVGGIFLLVAAIVTGLFSVLGTTPSVTDTELHLGPIVQGVPMSEANPLDALPAVGALVLPSRHADPATLVGLKLDKNDPFHIDFIISRGDSALDGQELADEALTLIMYFLTSLTLPEDQLWVNLSPYEQERIITDDFASTRMGKDFLQQDYLLKQLAASLTDPEGEIGSIYWTTIHEKVRSEIGTADLEVNSFNKVWIVPGQASVVLSGDSALVTNARLAVLTDYDYLAAASSRPPYEDHGVDPRRGSNDETVALARISSEVTEAVLIPELEKEVNYGENFGPVRQAFDALILATWYKQKVRDSLLNQAVADKLKLSGLAEPESDFVEGVYARFLEAFDKGVFNYIREDYDPDTQDVIPRKYFSGGITAQGVRRTLAQPRTNLGLRSLQTAVILVHATLFAAGGDALATARGPAPSEANAAVVETVSEDPGGIDFGRGFTIEELGEATFAFERGALEMALAPNAFSPQVLRLMAFSSLGALLESEVH